jgi:peptide/nickel transport system permease protein
MYKYIIKRLIYLIPVLLCVTLLIFTMLYITPGDPARMILGNDASDEAVEQYREELGLNDPFWTRYFRYLVGILHGDLGTSYTTKMPVAKEIAERFPTTFVMALLVTIFGTLVGVPLGIISAIKQNHAVDYLATTVGLIFVSMPSFWLGLMMIVLFGVKLKWFPTSGWYGPQYAVLPAVTVGLTGIASRMRMTRSSMLEVIRSDYIRTARAKGQTEFKIITGHALQNALLPVVTQIGMAFGTNMGGMIITEQIFAIPGLGKMMTDAVNQRNHPVVQGGVLWIAFATSIVNLIVDVLYAYIDPRLKAQYVSNKKKKAQAPKEAKAEGGAAA